MCCIFCLICMLFLCVSTYICVSSLDYKKKSIFCHSSTALSTHFLAHVYVCVLVPQSRLTLCDPMDCSLTVSSVHGIL